MEATFNWVIVDLKTTSPRILPCRLLPLVGCKNRWLFTRMLTADQARDNFVDTLLNNNNIHLSILRIGIEFSEISLPVNTAFQLIHLPYLLNVQTWSRSDFVCSSLLNKVKWSSLWSLVIFSCPFIKNGWGNIKAGTQLIKSEMQ